MFTTYYSDSLEILALIGGKLMHDDATGDPFKKEVIVTQNRGMFTYVKQVMTTQNGVFAQTENINLWNFIWKLAEIVLPKGKEAGTNGKRNFDMFSRDAMKWNLIGLFSKDKDLDKFPNITAYLNQSQNTPLTPEEKELRIFDFADSLADVYDKYQIYRSDWIQKWMQGDEKSWLSELNRKIDIVPKKFYENSNVSFENPHQEKTDEYWLWEAKLWKLMEGNLATDDLLELQDQSRSDIMERLCKELLNKNADSLKDRILEKIPGRIFIYGISSIPPVILDVLIALGQYIDVHFMFLNPCSEYWGDIINLNNKNIHEITEKIISRSISCKKTSDSKLSELEVKEDHKPLINENAVDEKFEIDILNQGNQLLLSCGKRGRDMLALLVERTADYASLSDLQGKPLINEVSAYVQDYNQLKNDNQSNDGVSILKLIKHDMFVLKSRYDSIGNKEPLREVDVKNPSVTFASCPTRLREVQVLYDEILKIFDDDAERIKREKEEAEKKGEEYKANPLKPRDIIVMAPDIAMYTPMINGVFEAANENQEMHLSNLKETENKKRNVVLPYAICDRSMHDENPILGGVSKLLSLGDKNHLWTARDLMDFLTIENLRKQFGIQEDELDTISDILYNNNSIIGLDSNDVVAYKIVGEPDEDSSTKDNSIKSTDFLGQLTDVTLKQGINRAIMGSMMPFDGSSDKVWNAENEGDKVRLIGAFGDFLTKILNLREELVEMNAKSDTATFLDWNTFIKNRICDVFFEFGNEYISIMNYLKKCFQDAEECTSHLKKRPNLTLNLIRRFFDDVVAGDNDSHSPFLRSAINFCTFVPMRSIPFKHVFMLGMNDGDFPSTVVPVSFDLMNASWRKGDRNRSDDDRYMFLEAITAAEESLHISFIGRDPSDGSEKNPSIVVSELMDYIFGTMKPCKDNEDLKQYIYRNVSLSPSDPANYSTKNKNQSYQEQWFVDKNKNNDRIEMLHIGQGIYPKGELHAVNNEVEIKAKDFLRFVGDPAKYFLEKKIGINEDYNKNATTYERFNLGFLEKASLELSLFKSRGNLNTKLEVAVRQGKLPAGYLGSYVKKDIDDWTNAVDKLFEDIPDINASESEKLQGSVIFENIPDFASRCIQEHELALKEGRKSPFITDDVGNLEEELKSIFPTEEDSNSPDIENVQTNYLNVRITGIDAINNIYKNRIYIDPYNKITGDAENKHAIKWFATLCLLRCALKDKFLYKEKVKFVIAGKNVEEKSIVLEISQKDAEKVINKLLIIFVLGQVLLVSFQKTDKNNNSQEEEKGTKRDFRNPKKILYGDDWPGEKLCFIEIIGKAKDCIYGKYKESKIKKAKD